VNKLYTIGYQGLRGVYQLLNFAVPLDADIIDIRFTPYSKNEEWTQATLLNRLCDLQFGGLKPRYVHIKELGNVNYKGDGPIELLHAEFGMARLEERLKQKPCILLCRCPEVNQCHRKVVADLAERWWGIKVEHLRPDTPMAGVLGGARPDKVIQFPVPVRTPGKTGAGQKVAMVEEVSQPDQGQMSLW
jgi:hypothetical protein